MAISEAHQAEAMCVQRPLLVLLFRLMAHRSTVDAALTLAQELRGDRTRTRTLTLTLTPDPHPDPNP